MAWFEDLKRQFDINFIQRNRWRFITTGLGNTLLITFFSLLLGLVIGIVIAGVRSTYDKTADTARPTFGRKVLGFFNGFCKVYLTVLRGTPVVVQLMIICLVIFSWSDNGVALASLAFGLKSGAYVA